MKETTVVGRPVMITDADGQLIDDIDTDQIYHNRHLAVTDIAEMGQYAFGNLEGWQDFPQRVGPGDILFVGENFGAGSSRQHAVDCFLALGVAALVGRSFGAIYKRNAINAGLPLLVLPDPPLGRLKNASKVRIELTTGRILGPDDGEIAQAMPMSQVALDIYHAGGLLSLAR